MPMSDANRVALRSFLTTRRGGRVLQDDIQVALHTWLVVCVEWLRHNRGQRLNRAVGADHPSPCPSMACH